MGWRRTFISLTYRFFILNLVLFFVVFKMVDAEQSVWVGRVFFIWTSVFNLFVVSVFWSLVTDVFKPGQGKRLFGIIAVGGTLGAILGSSITTGLVDVFGPINLLLVSALILELAVQASKTLDSAEHSLEVADTGAADYEVSANVIVAEPVVGTGVEKITNSGTAIGGGVLDGIRHILASPYLLGIASLILFYTISSTFLYFQQVDIVARVFKDDPIGRTRVFGALDVAVNVLTLIAQLFLTGRVMKWFGVGIALVGQRAGPLYADASVITAKAAWL